MVITYKTYIMIITNIKIILKNLITKILRKIHILPIISYGFCWGCNKLQINSGLCHKCWQDIIFIPKNQCVFCNNTFQLQNTGCVDCTYRSIALMKYKNVSAKLILQLKYGRRFYLGDFFINLISSIPYNNNYYILYIPHYGLKQITTSVNSSLLLANCFQKRFGGKIIHNVLKKVSKKRQKDSKNYEERMKNGFLNYTIQNGHILRNKQIILIDDVITTGSTLNACARMINQESPKSLLLIAICKV